jgi:hypothetical protein
MTTEEYFKLLEIYDYELTVFSLPDMEAVEIKFFHTLEEAKMAFVARLEELQASNAGHFKIWVTDTGGEVFQHDHVHEDEDCSLCARF